MAKKEVETWTVWFTNEKDTESYEADVEACELPCIPHVGDEVRADFIPDRFTKAVVVKRIFDFHLGRVRVLLKPSKGRKARPRVVRK